MLKKKRIEIELDKRANDFFVHYKREKKRNMNQNSGDGSGE